MIYFDTSYLARLYLPDRGFEAVRELAASSHIACALHGQAEMLSTFHRKLRERALTPKDFRALVAQFEADHSEGAFHWLHPRPEVLAKLREVYASLPSTIPLRAADALHLASASIHGFQTIYSHDAHFLGAAETFGLRGINVIR